MARISTGTLLVGAALAGAFVWGGTREVRASVTCSGDACDFQFERTVVRSALWSAPCSVDLVANLPPEHFDPGGGVHTPTGLVNGLCILGRLRGGLYPVVADSASPLPPEERAIDELQKAQSGAMLPAQRNVAALYEGLLHCRRLQSLVTTSPADVAAKVALRDRVCFHRAMAKASFARVEFSNLDVRYDDPAAGSVTGDIEAMSACYGAYLNYDYDALCGVGSTASDAQIGAAATAVADEILPNYFGGGDGPHGTPPLSAILARKVSMATNATTGANDAYAQLQAKNTSLQKSYERLAAPWCSGDARCIPARVNALADRYQEAVLTTQKLSDVVDNYVNGVFRDANGQDVRVALGKAVQTTNDNLAVLTKPPASGGQDTSALGRITALRNSLEALAGGRDAAEKATLAKACHLYYCEIYSGSVTAFNRTCAAVGPDGMPLTSTNVLCKKTLSQQPFGATTAAALCKDAGFEFVAKSCL